MGEIDRILDRKAEEVLEKVRKISLTVKELATEVHYILYRIRRVLEDEKILSYEDYYDIRESLDRLVELSHRLEEIGEDA